MFLEQWNEEVIKITFYFFFFFLCSGQILYLLGFLYPNKNFTWVKTAGFGYLGITFYLDIPDTIRLKFSEVSFKADDRRTLIWNDIYLLMSSETQILKNIGGAVTATQD